MPSLFGLNRQINNQNAAKIMCILACGKHLMSFHVLIFKAHCIRALTISLLVVRVSFSLYKFKFLCPRYKTVHSWPREYERMYSVSSTNKQVNLHGYALC